MRFDSLDDWLAWQETLNPAEIELGLDRVGRVLVQAKLPSSFNCPLITVAGTNGKGSVVAMLEAIALSAGLKVCSYTSPHITRYNERIRINGRTVDDDSLCEAFERIDQARGDIPVTYFEFGTLAAIELFHRQRPDLVILEVGLGGRLDAVNIMDADVSVLTCIAIDHVDWLGDNREAIGFEKAGIFRTGKTVIYGEESAPESVIMHARNLQCGFIHYGRDYTAVASDDSNARHIDSWRLQSCFGDMPSLPRPSLTGDFQIKNAATAVLALQVLEAKGRLPLAKRKDKTWLQQAVISGLRNTSLAGRFQRVNSSPQVYVDVAHNPQAALALQSQLEKLPLAENSQTWAIVAMLADKDVAEVITNVAPAIDTWCFAGLENVSRGLAVEDFVGRLPASIVRPPGVSLDELSSELNENQCTMLSNTVMIAKSVATACRVVLSKAGTNDRIIIFGSFYTVSDAIQFFPVMKSKIDCRKRERRS